MGVKLSNKDYLWSYIGVILSLSANIIIVPIVMYYLDGDHYGLWGVYQSLAGITILFDFGFTTTFARNINYCWNGAERLEKIQGVYSISNEPNFYLMKKTMTACQRVFLIISSLSLFLMLTIGSFYIKYISADLPIYEPLIAWVIYAVAIFLNLYYGYYGAFLRGVGAIQEVNKAMVYAKASQILFTVLLLVFKCGLIGTGIAYLIYGTLFRLVAKKFFYNYKGIGKGLREITVKIPGREVKEMFIVVWYNAWREGLVSLSNYLASQASTIIVSLYVSLTQTGAYALGVQITNAVAQIAGAMYRSNQPVLQSAYINNDKEGQKRTMSLIVISFVGTYVFAMILVIFIGLPILRIIKPETVASTSVIVGLGLYQLILNYRNCYGSYFSCTNRIPYVKAYLITSIVSTILSFMAIGFFRMGVWGIITVQIICQLMFNAWYWSLKTHQELQITQSDMIRLGWKEISNIARDIIYKITKRR